MTKTQRTGASTQMRRSASISQNPVSAGNWCPAAVHRSVVDTVDIRPWKSITPTTARAGTPFIDVERRDMFVEWVREVP